MTKYSVTIQNQSDSNWKFFVYQQPPPESDNLTLAWLVSDLVIKPTQSYNFTWTTNYSFVWSETGILRPGITFTASGQKDCDPVGNNFSNFTFDGTYAGLTDPVKEGEAGSLFVHTQGTVPASKFSIGVGMSGKGSYAVMAKPNVTSVFTPVAKYFVVAAEMVEQGEVMDITEISQAGELDFPSSITSLNATFTKDNLWDIGPAR